MTNRIFSKGKEILFCRDFFLRERTNFNNMEDTMAGTPHQFTIIVEPCGEGGYYAECPSLPGCHVQGETYEETLQEMKGAIEGFLEDYRRSGEEIPDDAVTVTSLKVAV